MTPPQIDPTVAIDAQAALMVGEGIGDYAGIRTARQQRFALVGGGGDGTIVPKGPGGWQPGFVARGEYEDGTGVELVHYVYRRRRPCSCAAPVIDYVFDGLPS